MKTHVFRLHRGQDLLQSITDYAKSHHITAGTVVSGVGCVLSAHVRDASGITIKHIHQNMEIVSLMGTVSENRTHLHISLAKEDLSVIGGHLVTGCPVNTTAEIVLLELDNLSFGSEFDNETGYEELKISVLEEK
jgi:predicted DNA-binding protein with PD1-like motif